MNNSTDIALYGTDWCLKSAALKNALQAAWADFSFHNVEQDENAAAEVRAAYEGRLLFPVVRIGDEFLKNPSWPELRKVLKANNLI